MSSKGCIVIGAGGHAKVVIELLQAQHVLVSYCIGQLGDQKFCCGIPVLMGDEHITTLRQEGYVKAFIALGDNRLREKLGLATIALGYELVNAISPQAIVSPSVTLGQGIAIMAGAVINAETTIAHFSIINTGAVVEHDCKIGQSAHIAPQCALAGNITVGNKAFLGIGTKVIPNITIGDDVLIGAGSLVIRDIPPGVKAYGVPTQIIT